MEKEIGWIALHRKILESDIWLLKPDKWLKIWLYILLNVSHSDKRYPRGTYYFTYDWIAKACKATYKQVEGCVQGLREGGQLRTQKATHGIIITVLNYAKYQDIKKDKTDTKTGTEREQNGNKGDNTSNNGNNQQETNYSLALGISHWNKRSVWPSGQSSPANSTSLKKLLPACRKETPDIITAWNKIKPSEEDWDSAIKAYVLEIANRNPNNDYANHRFSFYEFIKQVNGYKKYLNK